MKKKLNILEILPVFIILLGILLSTILLLIHAINVHSDISNFVDSQEQTNNDDCIESLDCESDCLNNYSYGQSISKESLYNNYFSECHYKCLTLKTCTGDIK